MRKIVLASASPRRRDILAITGLKFTVCVSDYEENFYLKQRPRDLARFLSRKKAEAVQQKYDNAIIIAADTFISFQDKILGKPHTAQEAEKMLRMLSGNSHSVITGFTVIDTATKKRASKSVETKVHFKKLTANEIKAYVRSGEPLDKAGAYAIQGLGAVFINKIEGDYFNVVGLPLCALVQCLSNFKVNVFLP